MMLTTVTYIAIILAFCFAVYIIASMPKGRLYSEFTKDELLLGRVVMMEELFYLDKNVKKIEILFNQAWEDFMNDKFTYDGATLVKERNSETLFEVAAFIHDWRNINGYISSKVDDEMFSIMTALNYPPRCFKIRARWTFFTWLNWLRHKYIKKDLRNDIPMDLFIIKK